MLTKEEKTRMKPQLIRTAQYISDEVSLRRDELIEAVCDANRPERLGKMSREDYQRLSDEYNDNDTQCWLREVFKGW